MTCYPPKFKEFARDRMKHQGDEIRSWAKSDNPLVSQTCAEIIEAAGDRIE